MREMLFVLVEVVLIALLAIGVALVVAAFVPVDAAVGAGLVVGSLGCLVVTVAAQLPAKAGDS